MGGAFLAPIVTAEVRTDTVDCTPGATKALADVAARTTRRTRYSIGAVCGATDPRPRLSKRVELRLDTLGHLEDIW